MRQFCCCVCVCVCVCVSTGIRPTAGLLLGDALSELQLELFPVSLHPGVQKVKLGHFICAPL